MTNISLKYCLGLGSPCDGFDSIYKCCQHASLFGMMRFYHVKLLMFRIIFQATCIVYIFLSLMNQKLVKDVWSNGCTITKIPNILKLMGRISRKEWLSGPVNKIVYGDGECRLCLTPGAGHCPRISRWSCRPGRSCWPRWHAPPQRPAPPPASARPPTPPGWSQIHIRSVSPQIYIFPTWSDPCPGFRDSPRTWDSAIYFVFVLLIFVFVFRLVLFILTWTSWPRSTSCPLGRCLRAWWGRRGRWTSWWRCSPRAPCPGCGRTSPQPATSPPSAAPPHSSEHEGNIRTLYLYHRTLLEEKLTALSRTRPLTPCFERYLLWLLRQSFWNFVNYKI